MKILLITSTAREHAIAEALSRSSHKPEIVFVGSANNPGLRRFSNEYHLMNVMDFSVIVALAKEQKPDFCLIGPDDPIGGGLADALLEIGVPSVAPLKALARIESSKGFTRDLMKKYNIDASPDFAVFTSAETSDEQTLKQSMQSFIDERLSGNFVVKYDALKGGKGVKVSGEHLHTSEEGVEYAMECIRECGRVVIEEKLIGVEFSYLSFVSGERVVHMPAVQDHKRAYNGDSGPNTGGMGTYSDASHSLPFLTADDIRKAGEINCQIAKALQVECGKPYTGILYGGFIAVKDGVKVIEYNARFGDPEALNILPILESDFVDICTAIIDGSLSEKHVRFAQKATVCKYIVPQSYPDAKTERGQIVVLPKDIPENVRIYFGDVSQDADGTLRLGGSRAIGIVGIANSLHEAEAAAQHVCEQIGGPVRFRSDIGSHASLDARIASMRSLRFI